MNETADHSLPDMEELFRRSGDDLLRYFSRRHETGDVARDLVQETFVQFARAIRNGQRLDSARGYLFGIARHVSQAVWAGRRHGVMLPLDEESSEVAAPAPDARIGAAREAIALLPALQREILDLRFSQGLSYAEMAVALDIPVGTVRSRLHHALIQLRSRIEADNIVPHDEK